MNSRRNRSPMIGLVLPVLVAHGEAVEHLASAAPFGNQRVHQGCEAGVVGGLDAGPGGDSDRGEGEVGVFVADVFDEEEGFST